MKDRRVAPFNDRCAFTCRVGQFQPNDFDLFDMGGNVAEWCADFVKASSGQVLTGLEDVPDDGKAAADKPGRTAHIIRLGNWDLLPEDQPAWVRNAFPDGSFGPETGFRCACNDETVAKWPRSELEVRPY